MTDNEKLMADIMAAAEIDMNRAKLGLYGGLAFNMHSGYEFMNVVTTCKIIGKNEIYWLNKEGSPVEIELTEALKICGTLMKSYGRSLAGDQSLINVHLEAYEDSNKPGAPVQNLKANAIAAATAEQTAAAKVAANAPVASS